MAIFLFLEYVFFGYTSCRALFLAGFLTRPSLLSPSFGEAPVVSLSRRITPSLTFFGLYVFSDQKLKAFDLILKRDRGKSLYKEAYSQVGGLWPSGPDRAN
jgi:hypothetical protein